jgi:hypothetical protein
MPVWHASVSITDPTLRKRVRSAGVAERAAVQALAGVGNQKEWWRWNRELGVGHLWVGVTEEEADALGRWPAEDDAGETGPQRPRTKARTNR